MIDNEELLFNELYEKTKDCGRTQFVRLLMEKDRKNQELNKKYLNAVADYETTMFEKVQLKAQQKEFIKYLEDEKDRLIKGTSYYYIDGFDRQHSVNETIYDEVDVILQKYKSIIGENDV